MSANTVKEEAAERLQLVCFVLANEEYAVDISHVQEVIRVQKITPVPQMPAFAIGVINIRGNIIPVFDLRRQFKLPEKTLDEQSKLLVLKAGGSVFSIIVDRILENIKIDAAAIDPAPEVKLRIDRACIRGLGELGSRMIIILDLDSVSETVKSGIGGYAYAG
jgi:purine-binding chemotaxis protein CheW